MQNRGILTRISKISRFHNHRITPPLPTICILSNRAFAGGDEIIKPKTYKNVFNRVESHDKKKVYYSVYPHDYNEPWPFAPVYDEDGQDLNFDPVWGTHGKVPNCSITGKPRRQLGHYPWLGRPIVPYDDHFRWLQDDQVAPQPLFRAGRYEANKNFYHSWITLIVGVAIFKWIIDDWWRGEVVMSKQRDQLWYREVMPSCRRLFGPVASCHFGNPTSDMHYARCWGDKHKIEHDFMSWRFESVYIRGAEEDAFADVPWHYFSFKTEQNYSDKLKRKASDSHGQDDHGHDGHGHH